MRAEASMREFARSLFVLAPARIGEVLYDMVAAPAATPAHQIANLPLFQKTIA
jgi:hypothetical protein